MSELLIPTRRGFLTGLVSALAAPAIVRATSIMPVKAWPLDLPREPLPGFGFESFVPPEGTSYQWIECGGLVLLERDVAATIAARASEIAASKDLTRSWFRQAAADGFEVSVRRPGAPASRDGLSPATPRRVMNADGDWVEAPAPGLGRWRKVTADDIKRWAKEPDA